MKTRKKSEIRKRFEKAYGHKLSRKGFSVITHGAGDFSIQQGKGLISVHENVVMASLSCYAPDTKWGEDNGIRQG